MNAFQSCHSIPPLEKAKTYSNLDRSFSCREYAIWPTSTPNGVGMDCTGRMADALRFDLIYADEDMGGHSLAARRKWRYGQLPPVCNTGVT